MSDLATRIEERILELNEGPRIPGVAVGVWHQGVEHLAGVGATNAEHPLPVDAGTLFQVASITKTFTATALLRLVERGRLELAAPVSKLLPDFRLAVPEWTDRVRVQHLLTHCGGWMGDHFFMTPPSRPTLEALVAEFADAAQILPPGETYSYDNAGFSVAGRIVEVLCDEPYESALQQLVLAPLGLDHSFFRSDQIVTHRIAAPHVVGANRVHVLRGGGWQPGWELQPFDRPAGGLVSCVADLLAWGRFQMSDGRGADGTAILRPETLRRMHTATRPAGCNDDAVGLAWMLHDWDGVRFSGHTGQTAGYLSELLIQRESDFVLVMLTNALVDGGLRRALRSFVLAECLGLDARSPAPMADPPVDVGDYLGRYDHPFAIQHLRPGEAPGELVLESEARPPDLRRWQPPPPPPTRHAFVAPDRLVCVSPEGSAGALADIGRGPDGRVAWLRQGGRVALRQAD
ncbi:MAG: serine hydrolase domain-containing protein [Myxococcota bacterium]